MVRLFVDAGIIVLTAFISPYRQDRQQVRSLLSGIWTIFGNTRGLSGWRICATRDQKGIYQKAKAGIIKEFTGISAPYEPPENPELVIQSHEEDAKAAAKKVVELIEKCGVV